MGSRDQKEKHRKIIKRLQYMRTHNNDVKKVRPIKMHVDEEWIGKKIDGHGGSYGHSSITGLAYIGYIGNKNSVQVFWYNVILFFKYLKRLLSKKFRKFN